MNLLKFRDVELQATGTDKTRSAGRLRFLVFSGHCTLEWTYQSEEGRLARDVGQVNGGRFQAQSGFDGTQLTTHFTGRV